MRFSGILRAQGDSGKGDLLLCNSQPTRGNNQTRRMIRPSLSGVGDATAAVPAYPQCPMRWWEGGKDCSGLAGSAPYLTHPISLWSWRRSLDTAIVHTNWTRFPPHQSLLLISHPNTPGFQLRSPFADLSSHSFLLRILAAIRLSNTSDFSVLNLLVPFLPPQSKMRTFASLLAAGLAVAGSASASVRKTFCR